MDELDNIEQTSSSPKIYAVIASIAALVGLLDSAYLTVKHLKEEVVPCSLITGCEQVLTSSHAEMFGIPLAVYGAVAYFLAFSLAILAIFGNRKMWFVFGLLASVMFVYTLYLLYVQGFVIEAFCQFCLLSAISSTTLFATAVISKFWRYK